MFEIFRNINELYVNVYFDICAVIFLNLKTGYICIVIVQDYCEMQFIVYTCTNIIREI